MQWFLKWKMYLLIIGLLLILLYYKLITTVKIRSEITKEISVDVVSMKYILQWTSPKTVPFVYMGQGREGFIDRNCPFTNCVVTSNRSYLSHITEFDVIAFAVPETIRLYSLPEKRSPHQKYAFATIESSDNYPLCSNRFDNFFNWTWTYRLDSEIRWGYITIRDEHNEIVGPNKIMHWMKSDDMKPVSDDIKEILKNKTKAAAWFVSNCSSRSQRESFVRDLRKELGKYDMDVDIYGKCGPFKCERGKEEECNELIKKKYYFYLSFENSFSEDYVTEKLLHALKNYAVPVVYGSANYSRFMPDDIYLNARELGVNALAAKMNELIKDPDEYSKYFKWKSHYTYHRKYESVNTDPYCLMCTILNNNEMVNKTTIYTNFREWWDPVKRC